jgi:hypothetical protein
VTLAEALLPLHRNYLRRLDEMVARLPPGVALTERTTRTGDGRFAPGESGLPLRFDVADARDGHTWEVHGAHPDEPLAREVRVGRVEVRIEPGNWEELPVVCVFAATPAPEDAQDLADLIRGFTLLAWHGGFAAGIAGADRWTGRAHGLRIELRENELWAIFDLGTCPPAALEPLCAALSGYCEERLPLAYVRIGGKP